MTAGLTQFLWAGVTHQLPISRLCAILRDYYDEGSPTEVDQALQLLAAVSLDVGMATNMLRDSSGTVGKGNAKASRCRALLKVADLLELAEQLDKTVAAVAELAERFDEVSVGLEPDIVIELLIAAKLNEVAAVEMMFSGVEAPASAAAPDHCFHSAEEGARRDLEARVRNDAAAREHDAKVQAILQLQHDAESRRPATQAAVMELMESEPALSRVIQTFMTQFTQKAAAAGAVITCEPVRDFMDHMSSILQDTFSSRLSAVMQDLNKPGDATDEDVNMLQSVVEDCLQTRVVLPVQVYLIDSYKHRFSASDKELRSRQAILKEQSQEFFGIPPHAVTRDGWSHAIDSLSDLDDALHVTPNMRLKILTYVKVAIERCYQAEMHHQGPVSYTHLTLPTKRIV
eukprot:TRINITY_DN2606_c0_g1_i3.p1 TRINITY_DN2606_c0_g1~~TRINITY_DN2606_c0_g1_i3.p1  ORF type:complete len:401 (-),score=105.45 TRINITY_DN2606_c0_g1_i3:113-1315(-)